MNKKQFEKLEKKTIKNIDLIPEDTDYCYTIDREKLKEQGGKTFELGIPIKKCPYFVWGKGDNRGCLYINYYGSDHLLYDSCKICNLKEAIFE